MRNWDSDDWVTFFAGFGLAAICVAGGICMAISACRGASL